jgi:hypothetical protein
MVVALAKAALSRLHQCRCVDVWTLLLIDFFAGDLTPKL